MFVYPGGSLPVLSKSKCPMHALSVLEFGQILESLAGFCETVPGQDAAHGLEPSFDEDIVWARQAALKEAESLFAEGPPSLKGLRDTSDFLKLAKKGAVGDGTTLWRTGQSLLVMGRLGTFLRDKSEVGEAFGLILRDLPELDDLAFRLDASLDGDGTVLDEASSQLSTIRGNVRRLGKRILDRIQAYTSGRHRDLLSDPIYTQRNGRYVVPLKAENRGKIRGIVHDSSSTGQTVFVEPEDVVAAGNELREAEAAERAEVERILKELSGLVGAHADEIIRGTAAAVKCDLLFGKCRLREAWDGCLAERAEVRATLELEEARHPALDRDLVVPLTLHLGGDLKGLLITGPNTGGKTVCIKMVGLAVAMVQAGLPVPAREAKLGVFSQIWADIGDEQSLQQSLSTFSGHIKNIAEALTGLKSGALVLMDEVGAGTDPAEGAALAQALLLEFVNRGAVVMASTHYGELKLFASKEPGFTNASMEFDLKSLRPTYRFQMGTPGSSHAFKIAKRYGVPDRVLDLAEAGFSQQEQDLARMIEELEQAQRRARKAQGEADRLAARLKKLESETGAKLSEAEEQRRTVRKRMADELDELLRQIRIEAAEVFEEVKRNPNQKGIDKARARLKDLQSVGRDFTDEIRPKEKVGQKVEAGQLQKGATVKVLGLNLTGTVLDEPKGKKVAVQAGAIRMDVEVSKLVLVGGPAPSKPVVKTRSSGIKVAKAQSIQRELHLRQMRAEDAIEALEKFIDDVLLAGVSSVRIVHGKGEGILRKITQDFLRRHPSVASYEDGSAEEGGQGVTVATFK